MSKKPWTPDDMRRQAESLEFIGSECCHLSLGQVLSLSFAASMLKQAAQWLDVLDAAFERVLIGGNSLAVHLTDRWPSPDTEPQDALRILCATPEFDMWCCWREIMLARTALAQCGRNRQAETSAAQAPSRSDEHAVSQQETEHD